MDIFTYTFVIIFSIVGIVIYFKNSLSVTDDKVAADSTTICINYEEKITLLEKDIKEVEEDIKYYDEYYNKQTSGEIEYQIIDDFNYYKNKLSELENIENQLDKDIKYYEAKKERLLRRLNGKR